MVSSPRLRERSGMALLMLGLVVLAAVAPGVLFQPRAETAPPQPAARPNVLLLTVDCLRADRLSCYGYDRPTSPGLVDLANHGVLFEDCIAQSAWTSPGLVTILTGLYPEVTGVRGRASIPPKTTPSLAKIFRKAGYEVPTLSYLASLQNYWNLGYETPARDLMQNQEDRLVRTFLEKPRSKPFFIWYHYRFVHLPFDPPEPWRSQFLRAPWPEDEASRGRLSEVTENVLLKSGSVAFTEQEKERVADLYDAEVRRMDAYVSDILASLEESGVATNTIVAVTADHGEEIFERGFVGHASTSFDGHLHREMVHVPLLLRAPGRLPEGTRLTGICGQVDVAPTLLDLAGIAIEPGTLQGRSLVPMIEGQVADAHPAVFSSTTLAGYQTPQHEEHLGFESVTTPEWRLIRSVPKGETRLFDRKNDPEEMKPVDAAEQREILLGLLERHREDCAARAAELVRQSPAGRPGRSGTAPPRILRPGGPRLDFEDTEGLIEVELESDSEGPFVAEYDVGTGVYRTSGTVGLAGKKSRFGPFSKELWDSLQLWNPWRFRVSVDTRERRWGPWVEFEIVP